MCEGEDLAQRRRWQLTDLSFPFTPALWRAGLCALTFAHVWVEKAFLLSLRGYLEGAQHSCSPKKLFPLLLAFSVWLSPPHPLAPGSPCVGEKQYNAGGRVWLPPPAAYLGTWEAPSTCMWLDVTQAGTGGGCHPGRHGRRVLCTQSLQPRSEEELAGITAPASSPSLPLHQHSHKLFPLLSLPAQPLHPTQSQVNLTAGSSLCDLWWLPVYRKHPRTLSDKEEEATLLSLGRAL